MTRHQRCRFLVHLFWVAATLAGVGSLAVADPSLSYPGLSSAPSANSAEIKSGEIKSNATKSIQANPANLEAVGLRLLSGWSPAYIGRPEMAMRFIQEVESRSASRINISVLGPEAIAPFEQFEPVAAGLLDLLFTHGAYHLGETGIGMAFDAIEADPSARHTSGLWAAAEAHYQKRGLRLLSLPTSAPGYHLLLREPIGESCDLSGRKIRGSPVYHGLIRALNAAPVVLPAGEIYAALEKGVIDGAGWPAAGSLPFRWYEVTKYYVRPTFGTTTHLILMNKQRFDSLSNELQTILRQAGLWLEQDSFERFTALVKSEAKAFRDNGLQQTQPCGSALEALQTNWANGVWRLVQDKNGAEAKKLRQLARTAGLTR